MCTFCYTPYIGCPKGRRHYYLQWLKCKTAIRNGHSYCPIGESTQVKELQKLSGNILACPFHTHIAIQQTEFEFRQRDEIPSPIESSEPSSPTTSNTTCVASDDESEVEVSQASHKSLYRPSSTALYLDLRFPNFAPIQRHEATSPLKTETRTTQRRTGGSLDSRSESNKIAICDRALPNSGKRRPLISPGLPASPAAYRPSRSADAKPTLKAIKTDTSTSNNERENVNKLSIPGPYPRAPSPPPPEIITTLPTPVDQVQPPNPDLLTRRLGPSTALTISITKAPKLAIQKITTSKSEPDLKSTTSKGPQSSKSTTSASSHHTFDSFLTPSGTLAPDSDRTLSANTPRRQALTTDPKNIAPWDQAHLPASISKPVNLEVGENYSDRKPTSLALDGANRTAGSETNGECPKTALLPAEMQVMMSKLESVGAGVGLGIGLAVTSADEGNPIAGHKRSCSATSLRGRMGMGLGLGLGLK
ncbi:hypothetical protein QBC32DRAFT_373589 [Pseudoneurospora amorphoporcata]|uniref:Uncharacterized protein n=1 Tax=Pseudoneurospora amorphoporcata TaxID=241081 RepID=A0AAN6NM51_9PEZI|nr:hypothetical protein QBC32DRAFT_373589 [Pseudoneurospora amorphoporcata]